MFDHPQIDVRIKASPISRSIELASSILTVLGRMESDVMHQNGSIIKLKSIHQSPTPFPHVYIYMHQTEGHALVVVQPLEARQGLQNVFMHENSGAIIMVALLRGSHPNGSSDQAHNEAHWRLERASELITRNLLVYKMNPQNLTIQKIFDVFCQAQKHLLRGLMGQTLKFSGLSQETGME
ncbi:hypothetical protein ACJX0J_019875, partial [Zea mays]